MCHTEQGALPKIAVLGSGKGSNARAILEAVQNGTLLVEVVLIVSDRPEAGILEIAEDFSVPSRVLDPRGGKRGHLPDEALTQLCDWLAGAEVELVVLAGFMRILRDPILFQFPNRIVNLHPSLLPKFPGLNTVERALKAGEKETGCTIHLVDSGIDTGTILHQEKVTIETGDTVESVTGKIHAAEHRAYPIVIQQLVEGLD